MQKIVADSSLKDPFTEHPKQNAEMKMKKTVVILREFLDILKEILKIVKYSLKTVHMITLSTFPGSLSRA